MILRFQEELNNLINSSLISSFPKRLLLEGPEGGGKKMACTMLSQKVEVPLIDITEKLTEENFLQDLYLSTSSQILLIEADKVNSRHYGKLLKLVEEPPEGISLFITTSLEASLPEAVYNRCQVYRLKPYTSEELVQFLDPSKKVPENFFDIANTPGLVKEYQDQPMDEIVSLANKIVEKAAQANFSNTLTIVNKLKTKNSSSGYPAILLARALLNAVVDAIKHTPDPKLFIMYKLIRDLNNNISNPNLNEIRSFENFLVKVRINLR